MEAGMSVDNVLSELIKRGTQRGFLTVHEVQQDLVEVAVSVDELERVLETLRSQGIRIEEQSDEPLDDLLSDESVSVSDPVKMYLQEIGRYRLLSAQQEVELAMEIEAGRRARERSSNQLSDEDRTLLEKDIRRGEAAQRRLVESNLRLVVSVARTHIGRGLAMLDLIQEGNMGLMRAVEKFDYRRGFRFSTYATWWIRQSITRAIADQSRTIRVPVHIMEMINKLVRVRRDLTQVLGRDPTVEEIASDMDLDADRVEELIQISQSPVSLESPVGEEEDSTVGDFVEDVSADIPVEEATRVLLQRHLSHALEGLSPREREVLVMRFGLEDGRVRTLEEVGDHFRVTRERVRQLEIKALAKLRHPQNSRRLEGFLEDG